MNFLTCLKQQLCVFLIASVLMFFSYQAALFFGLREPYELSIPCGVSYALSFIFVGACARFFHHMDQKPIK